MPRPVIQDIIVKSKEAHMRAPFLERPKVKEEEEKMEDQGGAGWKTYAAIIVLVALIGLFAAGRFVRATVSITPRQATLPADVALEADSVGQTGITLKTITFTDEIQGSAAATKTERRETYAKGEIVVYNAFGPAAQALVGHPTDKGRQTRFETPDGKIYRIHESVTVPGMKDGVPGEVIVTAYADEPGEAYNGAPTDFSIPGFKRTSKYEKFYGRSKTAFEGGFEGVAKVITGEEITRVEESLEAALGERIRTRALAEVPEGYLLYPGALSIVTERKTGPEPGARADDALLTIAARATGYLLKKDELEKQIVAAFDDVFEDTRDVTARDIEELQFQIQRVAPDDSRISFVARGDAHFVWKTDASTLLDDLRDAGRGGYAAVLGSHPYIESAEISFRPSWWRWLPGSDEQIDVEEVLQYDGTGSE